MLECVFLMYYDRRTKCASATFARLARAFERGALGGAPAAAAELVRYAQQMGGTSGAAGDRAGARHLRLAARAVRGDPGGGAQPGRRGGQDPEARRVRGGARHALGRRPERSRRGTRELALDAAHGPCCWRGPRSWRLRPRRPRTGRASRCPRRRTRRRRWRARRAATPGTARSWRCSASSSSRAPEAINATLHKSVLKNLLSSSLAAFDILPVHKLRAEELGVAVGRPRGAHLGPARAVRAVLGRRASRRPRSAAVRAFGRVSGKDPADAAPLRRALAALAEGPRAAACALAFLKNLPAVALPAPGALDATAGAVVPLDADGAPRGEWVDAMVRWREARDSGAAAPPPPLPPGPVAAAADLASAHLPGACVPRGAAGVAIARAADSSARDDDDAMRDDEDGEETPFESSDIVTWSAPADGTRVLVARLCVLSVAGMAPDGASAADAAELDASLRFLTRVLRSAPSFAAALAACDVSAAVPPGAPATALGALAAGRVRGSTADGAAWATRAVAGAESRVNPGVLRAALALAAAAPHAAEDPTASLDELTAAPLLRADGEAIRQRRRVCRRRARVPLRGDGPAVGLTMFERAVLPAERAAGGTR